LFIAVLAVGRPAHAQQSVTNTELQRLQDSVYDASRDVAQLRSRDASLAASLQSELDDLRDEVTYLRVKQRKNENVSRSDYTDLRDRIDAVRSRARGETSGTGAWSTDRDRPTGDVNERGTSPRSTNRQVAGNEVPEGTEFDVRLESPLSSATSQVEDRFEATTVVDLRNGDRVLVPSGSVMRGTVSTVNKAGHIDRKGSLTVAFDRIAINSRSYPIHAIVTQALESEGIKGDATKIGAGAGIGAIIGGILGGVKGALAGILIGGGGTIAATEGKDVELPAGTVLRVRLDTPLIVAR
jgi:hypothetical protein